MIQGFRNGQWVLVDSAIEGVHRSKSGKAVAIYQKGGQTSLGNWLPDHIVIVDKDGRDVCRLPTAQLSIEPMLDHEDHPPGRPKHSGWKPRP